MPALPLEPDDEVLTALRGAVPPGVEDAPEIDERSVASLPAAGSDAIVLTTPLDHLLDVLGTLRSVRRALNPGGTLICAAGNFADRDLLVQLFRSDPQQGPRGLLPPVTRHVHGYATALKTLLEAGLSGEVVAVGGREPDETFMTAAEPLLDLLKIDRDRAERHLGARFYVLSGRPVDDVELDEAAGDVVPLTFAVCVNDDLQLGSNLLASPPLAEGHHHELLQYRGMSSAAEGLNQGINAARHDLVVLIQQDIYIPSWWPARLLRQWRLASEQSTPAIAGPVGVRYREGGRTHVGHATDREWAFRQTTPLPADVDGLDELVLVVAKDVPLRFEPALGWHLYGTDFALKARAAGLRTAVLDVPCVHNSLHAVVDESYHHSEAVLATKWVRELPIFTNTSQIDDDPRDAAIQSLAADLEQLGRRFELSQEQLDSSRQRLQETRHGLKDSKRELDKTRRQLEKQRDQLDRTRTELTAMRSSRAWRVARRLAGIVRPSTRSTQRPRR